MGISHQRLSIGVLLAIGLGCAAPQHIDPRVGRQLPDVGLVIGLGQVDGREWMVGASLDQNLICSTLFVAGERQSTNCSGREAAGRNEGVVSISKGQPNLISGLTDNSIAWVEATGRNGSMIAPSVPLQTLGLAGGAFGLFIPDEAQLGELRFVDGAGNVVERQTLPKIMVVP